MWISAWRREAFLWHCNGEKLALLLWIGLKPCEEKADRPRRRENARPPCTGPPGPIPTPGHRLPTSRTKKHYNSPCFRYFVQPYYRPSKHSSRDLISVLWLVIALEPRRRFAVTMETSGWMGTEEWKAASCSSGIGYCAAYVVGSNCTV